MPADMLDHNTSSESWCPESKVSFLMPIETDANISSKFKLKLKLEHKKVSCGSSLQRLLIGTAFSACSVLSTQLVESPRHQSISETEFSEFILVQALRTLNIFANTLRAPSHPVCCSLQHTLSLGGIYNPRKGWEGRQGGRSSVLTKTFLLSALSAAGVPFKITRSNCSPALDSKGKDEALRGQNLQISWHSLGLQMPSCPPGDFIHLYWTTANRSANPPKY